MHGCNGHGICLRGICACSKGWFGVDCAVPMDAAAATLDPVIMMDPHTANVAASPPAREHACHAEKWRTSAAESSTVRAMRPQPSLSPDLPLSPLVPFRVYVYELPSWLNAGCWADQTARHSRSPVEPGELVALQHGPQPLFQIEDGAGTYSAYRHLRSRLLRDWGLRTSNPGEASLFYWESAAFDCFSNVGDARAMLRLQVDYIREHYPFWDRRQGADHATFVSGDTGRAAAYSPCPQSSPRLHL